MWVSSFTETRDPYWSIEEVEGKLVVKLLAAGVKIDDVLVSVKNELLNVSIEGSLFGGCPIYRVPVPGHNEIAKIDLNDGVLTIILKESVGDFERLHRRLLDLAIKVNPSRTPGGVYTLHYNKIAERWHVSDLLPHCIPAVGHLFETLSAAKEACKIMNEEGWRPIDIA